MKIVCFFSNKGGVGRTSLVYHLAWKMAECGYRVLVADLDPQASLSAMFLGEDELGEMLEGNDTIRTVYQAVKPLTATGDVEQIIPRKLDDRLSLLPGDIGLAEFEGASSQSWTECLEEHEIRPFYVVTAFYRLLMQGAIASRADVVLVDLAPNFGAINRSVLLAADHVVVPVGADHSSLHGLRTLGPALAAWREEWGQRRQHFESNHAGADLALPAGAMAAAGYITTQRSEYAGKVDDRWLARVPEVYLREVCGDASTAVPTLADDRNCLARIRHYRSLMPMAHEARKPMFQLTPADGAIGSLFYAARDCGEDFRKLAEAIAERCDIQRSDDEA